MSLDNKINYPSPYRLVMIQTCNNCQFCENPQGQSYSFYVDLPTHIGFISCEKCKDMANNAVKYWNESIAFGRVKHLIDRKIKIYRSKVDEITGSNIEDEWMIYNPIILNYESDEYVECISNTRNLQRYCKVDDILYLNK